MLDQQREMYGAYKNDQKIWPWLKMSDQILLILVWCMVYKKIWYMNCYTFFVIPTVCSIQEAMKNDYFRLVYNCCMAWWYTYNDLFYLLWHLQSFRSLNYWEIWIHQKIPTMMCSVMIIRSEYLFRSKIFNNLS